MPAASEVQHVLSGWQAKACKTCGTSMVIATHRDVARKQFCSRACHITDQKTRRAIPEFREARGCTHCGSHYIAVAKKQKFCSQKCTVKVCGERFRKRHDTLDGHFKSLLQRPGREGLNLGHLHRLYEVQGGKCAISGIAMTWGRFLGKVATHISIDRISSAGTYTIDNVQLVCSIVNRMKLDLEMPEFVELCRQVLEHSNAGT